MKKIKLSKEELSEKEISSEVFEFLNSNELGMLCGGDSYTKVPYIDYSQVVYTDSTYSNSVYIPK